MLPQLNDALRLKDHQQAGKYPSEQAKPAKDDFRLNNPGDDEHFSGDHPQQGDAVAAELERHRAEHERRTQHSEQNESRTTAARCRKLSKKEFNRAESKQRVEGEL